MADLTVPYAFCWDRIFKGIDQNGPYYKVSYYIANWANSDLVANELRGYTSRTGTTTLRTGPHQLPLSPNLCCVNVEIEGLGNPILNAQGYPNYDNGFLAHCEYRPIPFLPYATDPNNQNQIDPTNPPLLWCTQELDYETEEYVHERNQYTWITTDSLNGKPSGIPVRVSLGVTTMTITFHQLPYLPMGLVRSLRNKVNSVTLLGCAPGTLWFRGSRTTRDKNTDGTICQRVTMVFKERDVDWRMFLRKDKIAWAKVQDGSGNLVLSSADLTPLLQV